MSVKETLKKQLAICLIQEGETCKVYTGDTFAGFMDKNNPSELNVQTLQNLLDIVIEKSVDTVKDHIKASIPQLVNEINGELHRNNLEVRPTRRSLFRWF